MLTGNLKVGTHVVAKRDIEGWMGSVGAPLARKGARGIVRSEPTFLTGRVTVEFSNGQTAEVKGSDLKPTVFGHGEESWQRHQRGRFVINLLVASVVVGPALMIALARLAQGDSLGEAIGSIPVTVLSTLGQLLAQSAALIGLPLFIVLVLVLGWRSRR